MILDHTYVPRVGDWVRSYSTPSIPYEKTTICRITEILPWKAEGTFRTHDQTWDEESGDYLGMTIYHWPTGPKDSYGLPIYNELITDPEEQALLVMRFCL